LSAESAAAPTKQVVLLTRAMANEGKLTELPPFGNAQESEARRERESESEKGQRLQSMVKSESRYPCPI
jgi:hypothetical protein